MITAILVIVYLLVTIVLFMTCEKEVPPLFRLVAAFGWPLIALGAVTGIVANLLLGGFLWTFKGLMEE